MDKRGKINLSVDKYLFFTFGSRFRQTMLNLNISAKRLVYVFWCERTQRLNGSDYLFRQDAILRDSAQRKKTL
jgi:hypothetical protein